MRALALTHASPTCPSILPHAYMPVGEVFTNVLKTGQDRQWTILWSNRYWTGQTVGWTAKPIKPSGFLRTGQAFFFPILQIFVTIMRPINEHNSLPNTFKT